MDITNMLYKDIIRLIEEASAKGWSAKIRDGKLFFYTVKG